MWWWWLCLLLFAGGLVDEPHGFVKYWLKLGIEKRGGRMYGCEVRSTRERYRLKITRHVMHGWLVEAVCDVMEGRADR